MWSVNVSIKLMTSVRQAASASFLAQSLNRLILRSRSEVDSGESLHACSVLKSSLRSDSYSAAHLDLILCPFRTDGFLENIAKQDRVWFLVQWLLYHLVSVSLPPLPVRRRPSMLEPPSLEEPSEDASQWVCAGWDQQISVRKERKEHLMPSRLASDSVIMLPRRESATRQEGRHWELDTVDRVG